MLDHHSKDLESSSQATGHGTGFVQREAGHKISELVRTFSIDEFKLIADQEHVNKNEQNTKQE
jgi:hypothetical protein